MMATDMRCDWCDSPYVHRRVSAQSPVKACAMHYPNFLAVLTRRRILASRVTGR